MAGMGKKYSQLGDNAAPKTHDNLQQSIQAPSGPFYSGNGPEDLDEGGSHFNSGESKLYIRNAGHRPHNFIVLAVVVTFLINPLVGPAALVLSIMSSKAYKAGNIEPAKHYGRLSLWISVAGILVTIVVVTIVVIVLFSIGGLGHNPRAPTFLMSEGQ